MQKQLDLFDDKHVLVEKSLENLKKSCDSLRKSVWATRGEFHKIVIDLSNRLDILERNICKR